MVDEGIDTAKVRWFEFDLGRIFPPRNPCSIALLRLMLAVDDTRHVQKLLIHADERLDDLDELEKSVSNGEIFHLFRMLCGHLYEAGNAFRRLEDTCPKLLNDAVAENPEKKGQLKELRSAFSGSDPEAFHYVFLKEFRHRIGFHYKEESLREALTERAEAKDLEGRLLVAEYPGLGRYLVEIISLSP